MGIEEISLIQNYQHTKISNKDALTKRSHLSPLPLCVTQLFGGLHDISEQVGIAILLMLLLLFSDIPNHSLLQWKM